MDQEPTDPDRWIGYVVDPGPRFVAITIEGTTEEYTTDQARGIAQAIEQAADEVDRRRSGSRDRE
jgi:hypothetical protein